MGLESAETTLMNPGPRASGGVCGDIEDVGGRRACMELESVETTLTNPGPCASGGVCSDIEDAGDRACLDEGLCEEPEGLQVSQVKRHIHGHEG